MSEVKRFSSPPPVEGEPIPFEIEAFRYQEQTVEHEGEHRTKRVPVSFIESFHAVPDVSGGVLVQIDLMGAGVNRGSNARGGDALYDFFDALLVDEDKARFRKLIEDKDVFVHGTVLSSIALHFYELYTSRPTKAPAS